VELSSPQVVGCVAFILKGYPRLSETFIAQEILALEQRGLDILIVSLRHPTDRASHPIHQLIRARCSIFRSISIKSLAVSGAAGGARVDAPGIASRCGLGSPI